VAPRISVPFTHLPRAYYSTAAVLPLPQSPPSQAWLTHEFYQLAKQSAGRSRTPKLEALERELREVLSKPHVKWTVFQLDQLSSSAARLKIQDPAFLRPLFATCVNNLDKFDTRGLATVIRNMAILSWYDESVLSAVSNEAAKRLRDFSARDFACTLWALAKLRYHPAHLLEQLNSWIAAHVHVFSADQLANVVWACGTLELRLPAETLATLSKQGLRLLTQGKADRSAFSPRETAELLVGFMHVCHYRVPLGPDHARFLHELALAALPRLSDFHRLDLANCALATGFLLFEPPLQWSAALNEEINKRIEALNHEDLSDFISGLCKLTEDRTLVGKLLTELTTPREGTKRELSPGLITKVTHALLPSRYCHPGFMWAACQFTMENFWRHDNRRLADFLSVLAKLGYRNDEFLTACSAELLRRLDEPFSRLSATDLLTACLAMDGLGYKPLALLRRTEELVVAKEDTLKLQDLSVDLVIRSLDLFGPKRQTHVVLLSQTTGKAGDLPQLYRLAEAIEGTALSLQRLVLLYLLSVPPVTRPDGRLVLQLPGCKSRAFTEGIVQQLVVENPGSSFLFVQPYKFPKKPLPDSQLVTFLGRLGLSAEETEGGVSATPLVKQQKNGFLGQAFSLPN
jgi:hypothetical protein